MAKVYGIDLGTTYSAIATLNDMGMPEVIDNFADSSLLLASAVYFPEGGEPVIGEAAKIQAEVEPERVVQFVKRDIGKDDAMVREFDGAKYDPITTSSLILKRMKEYAQEQEHEVKDVVITCPAYFGGEERAATKQAGEIAGLNVLNIVNEPTAAALNYCIKEFKENRKIMVYDLGGGTFDITLFDFAVDEEGKATIDVIESGGNDQLGGIDWDARLEKYIFELYADENGISVEEIDGILHQIIKNQVEGVKRAISNMPTRSFTVNYEGDATRLEVTREKFEEITQDLVGQTLAFVNNLLETVNITAEDVDVVLLVGGSTKMPMIKAAVEGIFPGKVRVEDPDLAVAKGAALSAATEWNQRIINRLEAQNNPSDEGTEGLDGTLPPLTEEDAANLMIDVPQQISAAKDKLTRSLGPGILWDGEYMVDNLLFIGDELSSEAKGEYGTLEDNQSAVMVNVFENVARDRVNKRVVPCLDREGKEQYTDPALKVKKIGDVLLPLPPNTPKNSPIEVYFRSSAVGLEVRAVNLNTGESVEAIITSENTYTAEEVSEAKERLETIQTSGQI